jgi:hypothetical protein
MITIIYDSTMYFLDLQAELQKKRRKKILLGFKSYLVDCPMGFYFL